MYSDNTKSHCHTKMGEAIDQSEFVAKKLLITDYQSVMAARLLVMSYIE